MNSRHIEDPIHRSRDRIPLRQEESQTFAGAAGFEEFSHRELVSSVAAVLQSRYEFWCAFRQNDIALNHDCVATKMRRFLRCDIDEIGNMFANRVLSVFIERIRKPDRRAIWQRSKTGI